jgi:hypothetical protein
MKFTRVRTLAGTAAAATLVVGLTVLAAGPASAAPSAKKPGELYFVSGLYIERVSVAGGAPHRVVKTTGSITGIAIAGDRLFWVAETGLRNSISYVTLTGPARVHNLVTGLEFPVGLVAADGWLFWADQNAIGRVRPNGTHLTRRFIKAPQEPGNNGVANGLATNGHDLYFTRCLNGEIARVGLNGHGLTLAFIRLSRRSCPQAIAVGNSHLYWGELGSAVGRATLGGKQVNAGWLKVHTAEGPFNVAADNQHVYWDWGGVADSPFHVARAKVNGTGVNRSILIGQGAFLLTSPGANV